MLPKILKYPKLNPKKYDPPSPIISFAGYVLKIKNPKQEPDIPIYIQLTIVLPILKLIKPKVKLPVPTIELAKPSRPSIQLIALVIPQIHKTVINRLKYLFKSKYSIPVLRNEMSMFEIWIPFNQIDIEINICMNNLNKGFRLFTSSAKPRKKAEKLIIVQIKKKCFISG